MRIPRIIGTFAATLWVTSLQVGCYGSSGPDERFPFEYRSWSAIQISPNEQFIAAFIGKDRIFAENWISMFDSNGNKLDSAACGSEIPKAIVWDASSKYFLALNDKRIACLFEIQGEKLEKIRVIDYPKEIIVSAGVFHNRKFLLFGQTKSHALFDQTNGRILRFDLATGSRLEEREALNDPRGGSVRLVFPDATAHGGLLIWRLDCIEIWDLNDVALVQSACGGSDVSDYPVVSMIAAAQNETWGIDIRNNVFRWNWKEAKSEREFTMDLPVAQFLAHESGLYALRSMDGKDGHIRHYSRNGKVIRTIKTPWDNVFCMDLSRNKVAVLSNTGEIFVADL